MGRFDEAIQQVRGGLLRAPRDVALQRLEMRLQFLRIKAVVTRFVRRAFRLS
jgi:hypothetical protein